MTKPLSFPGATGASVNRAVCLIGLLVLRMLLRIELVEAAAITSP